MDITEEYKYENLAALNFIRRIQPALDSGDFRIRLPDKKIIVAPYESSNTRWIHVKMATWKDCLIGHKILFKFFNAKATKCMECYKVVVRPRTVKELFLLLNIQESMGYASKCGLEGRKTVPALYGGYFYTDSLEEGLERYKEVRSIVDDQISKDVGVILKRGCTEFEAKWGPSDKWKQTEEDLYWEKIVYGKIEVPEHEAQDGLVKIEVAQKWLEWAWEHGDMTCMEFNNGEPYQIPYVTYHKEV